MTTKMNTTTTTTTAIIRRLFEKFANHFSGLAQEVQKWGNNDNVYEIKEGDWLDRKNFYSVEILENNNDIKYVIEVKGGENLTIGMFKEEWKRPSYVMTAGGEFNLYRYIHYGHKIDINYFGKGVDDEFDDFLEELQEYIIEEVEENLKMSEYKLLKENMKI